MNITFFAKFASLTDVPVPSPSGGGLGRGWGQRAEPHPHPHLPPEGEGAFSSHLTQTCSNKFCSVHT